MSDLPHCFFEPDGPRFVPTGLTRGPWSNDHQHGGPPAALVGRAIERFGDDADERLVARISFELFRPVLIAPLSVTVGMQRAGKTVDRVEATLEQEGNVAMRAVGLRVRRKRMDVGDVQSPPPDVPPPAAVASHRLSFFQHEVGYHRAVEARFARGEWGDRDVTVWARVLTQLLPDEPLTPLGRVLTIVDAESGICPPLDPFRFSFVNPDLTLYLERPLEGEWLGLSVRSAAQDSGLGLAESSLFDLGGVFGRSAQSLVIAARGG